MNKSFSIKTYAKINLTLDVTGRRSDGYHNIDSIFEEISVSDTVTVSLNDSEKTTVSCNVPEVPCDERNIVWKAADVFFSTTGVKNPGINIHIQKNIPCQAGMGGGSTNAAGVFRVLNRIFDTHMTDRQLMEISVRTGADTPFFIKGGLAHITGIGDIITELKPLSEHFIVVAKGTEGVSTAGAYKEIDSLSDPEHQDSERILNACANDNITTLMSSALNTFELTTLPGDIASIKSIMKKHGSSGTLMTGSGAAVFGIFTDRNKAAEACKELKNSYPFAELCSNICEDRNTIF
ncbi:MAG: 4-(cytidine 5'-diphospho)-2-C-methyl-D-erythritol kinase [Oscillospiraceae bacterium]|nr:4-(cytidine 5'-diphospho)-2-C-methyl-D-erythritol kinase [Oscillospiraceae bacterium]